MAEDACSECNLSVHSRGLCRAHYERARRRRQRGGELVVVDLADLDVGEMRRLLAERHCPVCGAGPFRHPLSHTATAHGIHADDIKRRIGVALTVGFCDDDLRASMSAAYAANDAVKTTHRCLDEHRRAGVDAARQRRERNPTLIQQERAAAMSALLVRAANLTVDQILRLAAAAPLD